MIQAAAYLSIATVVLALLSPFSGTFQRTAQRGMWAGLVLVAVCLIGDVLT